MSRIYPYGVIGDSAQELAGGKADAVEAGDLPVA